MSLGYGGIAEFIAKDDTYVLYQYSVINYNVVPPVNGDEFDGEIWINITCFKKIADVSIEPYFENNLLEIINSKYAIKINEKGIDYFAIRLCEFILEEYQIKGGIPEKISFYY